MAGLLNHTIVDFIVKKLVIVLQKNLLTFIPSIMLQDL